jgi:hypothetical protein
VEIGFSKVAVLVSPEYTATTRHIEYELAKTLLVLL